MFDKLTDIAIMMIFTFVVIVILYLTYTYIRSDGLWQDSGAGSEAGGLSDEE